MRKYSILLILLCFAGKLVAQREFVWKPEHTEYWNNQPPVVTPGEAVKPPSDAIVLFDGKDLSAWESTDGSEAKWKVENGYFTVVPRTGTIRTKRMFGSCQLHIEWRSPAQVDPNKTGQGRGNSGIFLQSRYELQVLDGYNNPTYSNGGAGSIYKQTPPMVNACRKPGEWQVYDIIYTAPEFCGTKNELISPARITVIHNGVLIHNNTIIKGDTPFTGLPKYVPHGRLPIKLQDHGNLVSYRNIWIRDL